jgi:hypothetical protein
MERQTRKYVWMGFCPNCGGCHPSLLFPSGSPFAIPALSGFVTARFSFYDVLRSYKLQKQARNNGHASISKFKFIEIKISDVSTASYSQQSLIEPWVQD